MAKIQFKFLYIGFMCKILCEQYVIFAQRNLEKSFICYRFIYTMYNEKLEKIKKNILHIIMELK